MCMGTLSGKATLSISVLLLMTIGVYSKKKEFAPLGENSFSFFGRILSSRGANSKSRVTVKILKIGTPEIITIIVLQLEQLDFTVQYCAQKMQTE